MRMDWPVVTSVSTWAARTNSNTTAFLHFEHLGNCWSFRRVTSCGRRCFLCRTRYIPLWGTVSSVRKVGRLLLIPLGADFTKIRDDCLGLTSEFPACYF